MKMENAKEYIAARLTHSAVEIESGYCSRHRPEERQKLLDAGTHRPATIADLRDEIETNIATTSLVAGDIQAMRGAIKIMRHSTGLIESCYRGELSEPINALLDQLDKLLVDTRRFIVADAKELEREIA